MFSRVKVNLDDDGLDLDAIHQIVDSFENNGIDSDEPQELGAPEFLDDNKELILDKCENLLKADMPPLRTLQQEDESLVNIIEGVKRKEEKYNDFVIYDNALYHIANPVKHDTEIRLQLVIPKNFREGTLLEVHDNFGHVGIDKTHYLLRSRYYWPGMYKDVVEHLDTFDSCKVRKIREQRAPMQEAYIPQYPFEYVGIDTTGPFPESDSDD